MTRVLCFIRRFAADETGSTAIDYGIMVGMVFLVVVVAIEFVTSETNAMYTQIQKAIAPK